MVQERGDVWLRFGVAHQDGQNSLVFLDGVSGTELYQQEERTWAYNGLSLFDRVLPSGSIKHFIENGEIVLDDQRITMPEIPDAIDWTRHPSLADCHLGKLLWPATIYTITNTQQLQLPRGLLIGKDSPSFQSYRAAFAAFLGVDLAPGNPFDRSDISLCHQDRSGRITKVDWLKKIATIDVVLEGDALAGSVIELASPSPGEYRVLSEDPLQNLSFNIPDTGLLSGSWLVLRRDGEWMDYKFLNRPYAGKPDSGVEIVVDEQDEVQSLISQGEGLTVEFKENVPVKPGKERYGVCKTIAAFANGLGGTILLGVRDDGSINGVTDDLTTRNGIDSITNWIKTIVSPLPLFDVRPVEVVYVDEIGKTSNLKIIVIPVEHGSSPPYCIKPDKPEYYVRRGATTFPAAPEQVRSLALESLQTPPGSPSSRYLNLASG